MTLMVLKTTLEILHGKPQKIDKNENLVYLSETFRYLHNEAYYS